MPCKAFLSWWPFFSLGLHLGVVGGWGGGGVEVLLELAKLRRLTLAAQGLLARMADGGSVLAGAVLVDDPCHTCHLWALPRRLLAARLETC